MTEQPLCRKCGSVDPEVHSWVEGDCILPHRRHSKVAEGFVCQHCIDRWVEWLGEVVELYATLADVLPLGSIPDDTAEHKHTKRDGSPAMFRLDAYALMRPHEINPVVTDDGKTHRHTWLTGLPQVPDLLANWAEAIWDANQWGADWPTTVTGAAAAIRANTETIAHLEDVDTFDAELKWIRRTLRTTHGMTDPQMLGRCLTVTDGKDCGGLVMPSRDQDKRPRCTRCHRRYDTLDLVRLKAMERSEAS